MSKQLRRYCVRCGPVARLTARYCPRCGIQLVDFPPETCLGPGGRYRIELVLGGGGFGLAYQAFDQRLERPCVVKQLVVQDAPAESDYLQHVQASFAREARLLATLNTPGHPNLPEIYEYLPDQHCLVMKYIAGQSLQGVLQRRKAPLPVALALRYGRDVAAALVYMHGRCNAQGEPTPVLHRDIKPDNILLDSTERIWLIDFGLAWALHNQHELAAAGYDQSAGTPGYTALEQWQGHAEPRSDVYALAATLHVLLTNVRPTVNLVEALAHGVWPALPPVRHINPEVSEELAQLIQRATAPTVHERPDAATFLHALDTILNRPAIPAACTPDQPPHMALFVGRTTELVELTERLNQLHLVVLTGLAGVGKTGLAITLARQVADPQQTFWHIFHPNEKVDRLLRTLAGFLAEQGQPNLLRLLTQAAAGGSPVTFDQSCDYLLDQLRGHAYLLCLDDVHLLNDEAQFCQLAQRLCTASQAGELTLLATARQAPLWLQGSEAVVLGGISAADGQQLLQRRGLQLDATLMAQLYAHTEGNAKLLHLAIDLLQHTLDPAALLADLAQTRDITNYLVQQVDRGLTAAERAVMEAVAVLLGYGGTRDALEWMLGADQLWDTLQRLSERYLLTVTPGAWGVEYGQHAIVRAFYYQRASQRQRRVLHQRAGAYYAREEPDALRAGQHLLEAGEHEQAAMLLTEHLAELINQGKAQTLRYLLERLQPNQVARASWSAVCTAVGELATLLGAYGVARDRLEQALRAGATLESTPAQVAAQARCRRLLGLVGEYTGNYAQAAVDCRNGLTLALSLAQPHVETARLYAQLAAVLVRMSELDAAETACAAGLAALPTDESSQRERIQLWQLQATIASERGRYDVALELLEQSQTLAYATNDRAVQALVCYTLGMVCYRRGEIEQARHWFAESLRLRTELGDEAGRIAAFNGLGLVQMASGALQAAMACFTESSVLCGRLGMPANQAAALLNLGQLQLEQSQVEAAHHSLQQACAIYTKLNNRLPIAHCRYLLGDLALLRGDPAAALVEGDAALALAEEAHSPALASCALRVLGEALAAQGQLAAAEERLGHAWHLQTAVADPYDTALILTAWAALAQAQGAPTLAHERAAQALILAREQQMARLILRLEELLERVA